MAHSSSPENQKPFLDLLLSIVIPSVILMKFSSDEHLGPVNGLLVALSFPCFYFLYELFKSKKTNLISILGIVSVLLTGGIGLLALDPHWVAVKEAAVPAIIGLFVLGSLRTPFPLVKKMIYNDAIIDTKRVSMALEERHNQDAFERLLTSTSYLLSFSFFLSSALNYGLAKYIVVTNPAVDQVAFNEEIGRMTALSYPVIVVPSMLVLGITLWLLIRGIRRLTNLPMESIFNGEISKKQEQK